MKAQIFTETVLWQLGPLPVTRTMVTSLATTGLLVLLAVLLARAVRRAPEGRLAALGRLVLRSLGSLVEEAAGTPAPWLESFAASLFLFISGAAVVGQLPGIPAPTANLAATSALAVLVFLAVPVAGVHARGWRDYFRHYLSPNPILFPLHVMTELSRTVALALRLFGNMMSGHLVVALIVALAGLFVPVPLMALDLFIGILQAYIFTILACVYIGAAIRIGDAP
ncbi:MAG: F0F1 ATP synthase subunit A [Alcanivorax sp.]|nr:F0F1 ATP synthase subunit A [Alcanivorax sp.]